MSKTLRTQLIAFCVIAAVGIAYVGANYVRLPSLLGIGQYQVYLDLPDTGGVEGAGGLSRVGGKALRLPDRSG